MRPPRVNPAPREACSTPQELRLRTVLVVDALASVFTTLAPWPLTASRVHVFTNWF